MKPGTRACIAFIAGILAGKKSNSIYDHTRSKHINISGKVESDRVNIFDHDRSCHVSGSIGNLYDFGNSAHISFNPSGTSFKGYDYDTSSHFSGNVSGNSISIHDFGESSHFRYSI